MASDHYSLLNQACENETKANAVAPPAISTIWRKKSKIAFSAALLLSLCCNMLIGIQYIRDSHSYVPSSNSYSGRTPFAGLSWDTTLNFTHHGVYADPNETISNNAWSAINYDAGSVALSDEYADSMGLPRAQRFPWDESKGLYFLNGPHSLHCLTILRRSMLELRDGLPLYFPFGHSMHCLDALRQDVICFADDTPRYTREDHPGMSGEGQGRKCRDWSKLEAFSKAHSSCWRDIEPGKHIDTLLRYRYCPPGSPYSEKVQAVFGKPKAEIETEVTP